MKWRVFVVLKEDVEADSMGEAIDKVVESKEDVAYATAVEIGEK